MNIRINDELQVVSDERQFIVQEIGIVKKDGETKGNEYIRPLAYLGTLEGVYQYLVNRTALKSEADNFKQLFEEVNRTSKEIRELMGI